MIQGLVSTLSLLEENASIQEADRGVLRVLSRARGLPATGPRCFYDAVSAPLPAPDIVDDAEGAVDIAAAAVDDDCRAAALLV